MIRTLFAAASTAMLTLAGCAQTGAASPDGDTEPATTAEATDQTVQVMVLGVYHFDNPGRDLNNIETDNVLSDKRQRELAALGEALVSFEPTTVAIEYNLDPPYTTGNYKSFTPDDLSEVAGEDFQIGFRVAHLAGLSDVHGIDEQPEGDEPDYFPYGKVAGFAERAGRSDELARMSDFSEKVAEFETYQETSTIPSLLKLHNTGFIPDDFYWEIIGYGEGEEQPGAELAAYWFMRNAKIFNKLQQVTEPGDRVLVVYGSGHKAWLDQLVEKAPGYELVDPVPYLEKADRMLAVSE